MILKYIRMLCDYKFIIFIAWEKYPCPPGILFDKFFWLLPSNNLLPYKNISLNVEYVWNSRIFVYFTWVKYVGFQHVFHPSIHHSDLQALLKKTPSGGVGWGGVVQKQGGYCPEGRSIWQMTRVVWANFGHLALTTFTKKRFLLVKNIFATIVNVLSVLKLFQLPNGNLFFS